MIKAVIRIRTRKPTNPRIMSKSREEPSAPSVDVVSRKAARSFAS
jgi:hypothetical protein